MAIEWLEQARENVETELENPALDSLKEKLPGDDMRAFTGILSDWVTHVNSSVGIRGDVALVVRNAVVHGAFPAYLSWRQGNPRWASDLLVRCWVASASVIAPDAVIALVENFQKPAEAFGVETAWSDPEALRRYSIDVVPVLSRSERPDPKEEHELLVLYNWCVAERIVSGQQEVEARRFLGELRVRLNLSFDELGQMLGVNGETVRRWERGGAKVSDAQMGQLIESHAALNRLLRIFRSSRLPNTIRRKAELFDGERAIDLILRGRIAEVANRYELALSYQT